MHKHKGTIKVPFEIEIEARYEYFPASKGSTEKGGRKLDPDEPAYYEIEDVGKAYLPDGQVVLIDLTEDQIAKIQEALENE